MKQLFTLNTREMLEALVQYIARKEHRSGKADAEVVLRLERVHWYRVKELTGCNVTVDWKEE